MEGSRFRSRNSNQPQLRRHYNRAKVRYFLEDKPGAIADYQKAAELYQKSGNTNDDQDAINHIQRLQK